MALALIAQAKLAPTIANCIGFSLICYFQLLIIAESDFWLDVQVTNLSPCADQVVVILTDGAHSTLMAERIYPTLGHVESLLGHSF